MKVRNIAALCAVLAMAFSVPAFAEDHPINIGLVTPVQIVKAEDSVKGFSLNILYGKNASVTGLDLGLINHMTTGMSKGLAYGLVNITEGDFKGMMWGAVNTNEGNFEGLQLGWVNHTANGNGLQFGLVNYAQKIHGLQIGIINIISQDGFLPVFPIVNWSF